MDPSIAPAAPDRPPIAQRLVFGEVAAAYDELRPGYPAEVIGAVLAAGTTVLEVGAGTGKATRPLLARGAVVHALEPSAEMAAVLVQRCRSPQLTVTQASVEDADLAPAAYDVVVAAQSWHWVAPWTGTRAARRALRPDGVLALCWNHPEPLPPEAQARVDDAYERHAPTMAVREVGSKGQDITDAASPHGAALAALFERPTVREVPWTARYQPGEYAALLGTQSDHRLLPADQRDRLLRSVAGNLADLGFVEVGYRCRLVLAAARR